MKDQHADQLKKGGDWINNAIVRCFSMSKEPRKVFVEKKANIISLLVDQEDLKKA